MQTGSSQESEEYAHIHPEPGAIHQVVLQESVYQLTGASILPRPHFVESKREKVGRLDRDQR